VAQVSSRWQQRTNQLQGSSPPEFKLGVLNQLPIHHLKGPKGWLLASTVTVAMLFWIWKLLIATGVGIGVMLLVYLMQEWNWQGRGSKLRKVLNGANRQLILAVGSGGVAAFSTYMAVSIWVDSDSPWIATGAILQGLGTLAVLLLLIRQTINPQASSDETIFNHLLADLTHTDPLKRLIAVRQLTHLVTAAPADQVHPRTISQYFRLMLNREQEPVVRDAVVESLQALDNTPKLAQGTQPLSVPTTIKRSATKARQRIS
jgi:hypothetical protein